MKLEQYFEYFIDGYTPANIVKNLDLSEDDVMGISIKVNAWLRELQQEANAFDSYKRFK